MTELTVESDEKEPRLSLGCSKCESAELQKLPDGNQMEVLNLKQPKRDLPNGSDVGAVKIYFRFKRQEENQPSVLAFNDFILDPTAQAK